VVALTAAMSSGTGLDDFAEQYPDRFFDVGIAEGHAGTFAAAMAAEKCKPYLTVYSTFMQRAYDQIFHDVCLQHLPVTFALDRAGLTEALHHLFPEVIDPELLRTIRVEARLRASVQTR